MTVTAAPDLVASASDHRPRFPDDRSGVAILGCGTIAHTAHLPAYERHGVEVVGVWSRTPATTAATRERFPSVERVYSTAEELLADPRVRIVDLAAGPADRVDRIAQAVAAGKHVLAQKPLVATAADLDRLAPVLERAEAAGLVVAVNQNARWAPAWRAATLLVRAGAVGHVVGVTHVHDKPLPPIVGTDFDAVPHMLISDYLVHWLDITATWVDTDGAAVRAFDSRVPGQPDQARNPWSATITLTCADGATASIRVVGDVTASHPGCPFWIHGTAGSIRGSLLGGSDRLTLDRDGRVEQVPLRGEWFVDGFAGTMAELMSAVAEDRRPEHAATEVARTVRLGLAAVASAEGDGSPVVVAGA